MLNLKDISLYNSGIYISRNVKRKNDVSKIIEKLLSNGITDFQQLQDYINSFDDCVELEEILLIIEAVEKKRISYNQKRVNFKIYSIPVQENIRLIKNDVINNCSSLILANPMQERPLQYLELNKQNINFAKHAISHFSLSGKNALCNVATIGNTDLDKIYSAIKLYDEQVLRQYEENKDNEEENIFLINQKKKKEIVLQQYRAIVEYILDKSKDNTFIWGELTPRKQILMEETIKSKGKYPTMRKENLVNIITNYTTLSELGEGIVKTKTLDRFIVK